MSTYVDAEDLESTRSERLLAVVLTAFLLVGSIWFYVKVADWVRDDDRGRPTTAQQQVLDDRDRAWEERERTEGDLELARTRLDVARSDYEVAAETGADLTAAEAAYRSAQSEYDAAASAATQARAEAAEADRRAKAVEDEVWGSDPPAGGSEWLIAGIRFLFVAGWVVASYLLIGRLRRRQPRYLPLGFGVVATGAVLALVFATDYVTDYVDPLDLGPIVLSLVGVAATLAAFAVLQRYLGRHLPGRRVRRGECPYCGYPVRGTGPDAGPHCEGCGREVVGACTTCGSGRRVGSSHCVTCGAA